MMKLFLLSLPLIGTLAQAGVLNQKAPALQVDKWVSLPEGQKTGPDLHKDWKGKVIYLYFFQSWCPGCHSSGFPTLQELHKKFGQDPDVRFASIQTVFEGFGTNTPKAAREIARKYKLSEIPVGHSGSTGNTSKVMRAFQTRGTPWTVIIGKDGKVKFENFHLKPSEGEKLILTLKKEK